MSQSSVAGDKPYHWAGSLLYLLLFALLSVGCGDSGEDFVVTGNTNNPTPVTTGNLTFEFATAQALVPVDSDFLEFEFFDSEGELVYFAESRFANLVTVEDLPLNAVAVVITVFGGGGVPLSTLSDEVEVVAGDTVTEDLSDAVEAPITFDELIVTPTMISLKVDGPTNQTFTFSGLFSSGHIVRFNAQTRGTPAFSGFDDTVVTINPTGTVRVAGPGSTSIDVTFTLDGVDQSVLDIPATVAPPAMP